MRESACVTSCEWRGQAETERERERIPNRLYTVSIEPNVGLDLMNHEIVT